MNQVVKFQEPRLPFHPAVEERFGVDKSGWKVLVEAIFPAARTVDSVTMALGYCKARKLDPFKRPVHIVPVWNSAVGAMVETVWPSISELRTTASRTGEYAGIDEVEFGPPIERTFTGMVGKKGDKEQVTVKLTFPEWGKITVYRFINGHRVPFHSPKIFWLETYATRDRWCDVPNEQWARRPYGQFEKCIEAAGLRRAFPEEIGNEYSAEEMEGQQIGGDTPAPVALSPPPSPPPAPPAAPPTPPAAPSPPKAVEAEIIPPSPKKQAADDLEIPPNLRRTKAPSPPHDEDGVLIDDTALDVKSTEAQVNQLLEDMEDFGDTRQHTEDWWRLSDREISMLPPAEKARVEKAYENRLARFED